MDFKEQYKKYLLIAIIITLGVILFFELIPFMSGILGAMTIYILLRKQMSFLTEKYKLKKGISASILLLEAILLFLVPLFIIVMILVDKVGTINLDPQKLLIPIQDLSNFIQKETGYDVLKTENLSSFFSLIPQAGQFLMNGISSFVINIFVLIIVLYFMLTSKDRLEKYIYEILPFSDNNKVEILHDINKVVTSNAIGIPLLGIIQGTIALLGYYIFQVPSPLLFGLLTCFATIIPMVGAAIIWIPLAIYLASTGNGANAIGLVCYGALVVSQIDNLIRFILQKKMANIHPLITIFGVVIGLSLFGFMGIIFGPLLLSIFILCFNILKKEYLK